MTTWMARALLAMVAASVAFWVVFGGLLFVARKANAEEAWKTRALGGVVLEAERVRVGFARERKAERRVPEPRRIEHRRRKPHKRRIGPVRKVAKVLVANRHVVDEVCRSAISVVGDQYTSDEGARREADKAWSQTVRWQLGERWMDRDNASAASYECGRSSVGSIAGQVFHRCRLTALPCRPQARGDGK